MYEASGMHPSDCDNVHPEPTEEEMIAIHQEEDKFWQEVESLNQQIEAIEKTLDFPMLSSDQREEIVRGKLELDARLIELMKEMEY